jgi:hypothetical protein
MFTLKIWASLVTGWTGSALYSTNDDFAADIGLTAVITVNTEVLHVYKKSMVFPHAEPVSPDFFGDGSRVLTEGLGNVFEGTAFIEGFFNVQSVIESQVFLIAWY